MSEDDTYNMLKGCSEQEATDIITKIYTDLVDEVGSNSVPLHLLRERADQMLKPYGRSYTDFFKWCPSDIE